MQVARDLTKNKTAKNQKAKTLWVVSELYYPEMTSTGYYLTKIAEGLTDSFDVKVLCGQPNYSARGTRAPNRECHNRVEIFRAFGTTLDKNVIFFRLINMLSLSFSIFLRALREFRQNDLILVVTTPPSLPFVAALASISKKSEYALLIHDNYPEILIAAGKASNNSLTVKFLQKANGWLYRRAKKIIVVGRDMKQMIEQKIGAANALQRIPVEVIQNWAELEQVEPRPRAENPLLEKLKIKEKFVFLYAGNMGYPNDLESIVECAGKLLNDPRFHFIFLGGGVKRKWLENETCQRKLNNITLLNPLPRSEQTVFLNACDVAIVSLVKKMWGVSMPSRTYNILAAGKPILALTDADSEVAKVIEEDKVGWVVPPNEPEKLLAMIFRIFDERSQIIEKSEASRHSALKNYSLENALVKYQKALTDIASDNAEQSSKL